MRLVTAGQVFSFNYTDPNQRAGLYVGFEVWDVTTTPSLFTTVLAAYTANGSYMGSFNGAANKIYLIIGLVFTDNTYVYVDTSSPQTADVYQVIPSSGIIQTCGFNYADYSFSSALNIQAKVWKMTTGTPVFIGTVVLNFIANGVYYGSFLGANQNTYDIISLVYTDDTFTVLDYTHAPGSDEYDNLNLNTNSAPSSTDTLVGIVADYNLLIGTVED